ncbi:hypothetical protein [Ornithobacterium rhinotracheale]|uniref:hypothetical protein n=1 Tax=Ornithobacterium rhinotracheale TaxID=28251 RepID=UPI001FF55651|nr:hypothetical protein [Ornithobacterium rhinotracheale]MCK0205027.1 hypothetical protein [Ornithobacterium rhinotracheale]
MTEILALIFAIVVFFLLKAIFKINKDEEDMMKEGLDVKISTLLKGLNEYCYSGRGKINRFKDRKLLNLYQQGSNQIVLFMYKGGDITMHWKIKYLHQEMIYEKIITNTRDGVSQERQLSLLKRFIQEFEEKYKKHIEEVECSGRGAHIRKQFGLNEENYQAAKDFFN